MPKTSVAPAQETPSIVIQQTIPPREAAADAEPRKRIDFWPYIASLSPADWRRHEVYLYRTKPVVGQKQREKYLDIYNQKFTIEDIKTRFGGEEFRAMLLRDGKNILTEEFAVEAAPKYDLAREIPGTDNSQAATIDKLVDRLTETVDNGGTDEAVSRSISIMGDAFDAAAKRLAGSPNGGSLLETIRTLKELGLISPPQQQNSVLEIVKVLKELGIVGAPRPADAVGTPISIFREMLGVIKEFAGEVGGGGKRDWKAELVDKGIEKIPEVLRGISTMGDKQIQLERERRARIEAAGRTAAIARGEAPPAVASPAPAAIPSGFPPESARASAAASGEAAGPAAAANGAEVPTVTMEQIFYNRIVEMVFEGEPGGVIMDFLYGADRPAYSYMLDLTGEQIKMMLGQNQTLSQILNYPQIDDLLEQIVEYSREVKEEMAREVAESSPVTH